MTTRPTITPRLLPAAMAAPYIGVSETTLRNLKIPRKKLGGKRLYEIADLDAFVNSLPYEDGYQPLQSPTGPSGAASTVVKGPKQWATSR